MKKNRNLILTFLTLGTLGFSGCSASSSGSGGTDPSGISLNEGNALGFEGPDSISLVKGTSFQINWTHVSGAFGYIVMILDGDDLIQMHEVSAPQQSLLVSGLTKSTIYTARVRSVDTEGRIDNQSQEVMATTLSHFSPDELSGLLAWFDASDSTTLFNDETCTTSATSNGEGIGCWQDKSGHGHHVTQSHPGDRSTLTLAGMN